MSKVTIQARPHLGSDDRYARGKALQRAITLC